MSYRPRRPRFDHQQWEIQRERFQIENDRPAPVNEHTSTLKEPVRKIIESLGLTADSLQLQLMNQWITITGKPLCRHIRPGPIQNKTLTVYVSNSAMLSELSRFQGPALLINIQQAVGKAGISKLKFLIDPDTRDMKKV
jgi:predicted nucleic acid-binding Zn ribbon protein